LAERIGDRDTGRCIVVSGATVGRDTRDRHGGAGNDEVTMSDSPDVPEWVARIIMKIASHEGISPEQAVRLLIIQGALTYKRSEEARRDEHNL
jgi:hypothetical protein